VLLCGFAHRYYVVSHLNEARRHFGARILELLLSISIEYLHIAPAVRDALAAGTPVVALESTIIAHGMPYPDNVATALAVEEEVRRAGALPATIAVIAGTIRVGLSPEEIESLGSATDVMKLSRNDLAWAIASGKHGATTVAATMICAHRAGIRVFATGGIGGVHRGAESSFDISADLEELARTPVAVVCAGAKGLLDLPKTLEYLETHGVPVVVYRSDEFPAFWSPSSGLAAPLRVESPREVARMLRVKSDLELNGGVLLCNPSGSLPAAEIESAIHSALAEAETEAIHGKAVTPYVLRRIAELTQGRSLTANISLVKSNARLAAAVARSLMEDF
jgi:pseudouridine-5'-phosphate glycosidase